MKNLILKSILVSIFTMFAFGNMNAQETAVPTEVVPVESVAKKEASKACCGVADTSSKLKEGVEKSSCKPGSEKACCSTTKEVEKVSTALGEVKKCCAKGEKKACEANKKVAEASCKPGCEKACCVS